MDSLNALQLSLTALPEEVLECIFSFLDMMDVQALRPTCMRFNSIGLNLQIRELTTIRRKVEELVKLSPSTDPENPVTLDVTRFKLETGCLLVFEAFVKITESASYHLVRERLAPPLPGFLLEFLRRSVAFSSHQNPLISKEMLEITNTWITRYVHMILLDLYKYCPIELNLLYKTVVGIMSSIHCAQYRIGSEDGKVFCKGLSFSLRMAGYGELNDPREKKAKESDMLQKIVVIAQNSIGRLCITDQFDYMLGWKNGVLQNGVIQHGIEPSWALREGWITELQHLELEVKLDMTNKSPVVLAPDDILQLKNVRPVGFTVKLICVDLSKRKSFQEIFSFGDMQ